MAYVVPFAAAEQEEDRSEEDSTCRQEAPERSEEAVVIAADIKLVDQLAVAIHSTDDLGDRTFRPRTGGTTG